MLTLPVEWTRPSVVPLNRALLLESVSLLLELTTATRLIIPSALLLERDAPLNRYSSVTANGIKRFVAVTT